MKRFVYKEKYARLLVNMSMKKSHQIESLAKSINAHTGHLRTVLDQWAKEGIMVKKKDGRDYKLSLTEKGHVLAGKFAEIMHISDNWDEWKNNTREVEIEEEKISEEELDPEETTEEVPDEEEVEEAPAEKPESEVDAETKEGQERALDAKPDEAEEETEEQNKEDKTNEVEDNGSTNEGAETN